MTESVMNNSEALLADGLPGLVDDWAADKQAFQVPWERP